MLGQGRPRRRDVRSLETRGHRAQSRASSRKIGVWPRSTQGEPVRETGAEHREGQGPMAEQLVVEVAKVELAATCRRCGCAFRSESLKLALPDLVGQRLARDRDIPGRSRSPRQRVQIQSQRQVRRPPAPITTPLGTATVTVSPTNVVTVDFAPTDPSHTFVAGLPFAYPPGPPVFGFVHSSLETLGGTVNIDTVSYPPGPPVRGFTSQRLRNPGVGP